MKLPIIIVFDLDGTIIGNSDPFNQRDVLYQLIKESVQAEKLPSEFKVAKPKLINIPTAFIRPGFKEFMVKLKEMFPTVECFVYSLGNKEYVAKFINYIEQITDVQFQRPLLARDESVIDETYNYKKSVKMNFPTIINALSDRYPALKDSKVQDYVLNNRFAFIDNSDVVWDIPEKWIAVSTYAYEPVIDIAESIPIPLRKNKFIQDFLTHSRFNVFREPEGYNEDERNMMYHNWMANCYAEVMPTNKKAMEDKFFITLQKALAKVKRSNTPFSEINMKNIKKALS